MQSTVPAPAGETRPVNVGIVSLGCAKNLVDSEVMAGHLRAAGHAITPDADAADVLIVNTCGFIDAAKEESIRTILEAHRDRGLHRRRRSQKLVVAGCLTQRYQKELPSELPEVDAFVGLDELAAVPALVSRLAGQSATPAARSTRAPEVIATPRSTFVPDWDTPRLRLTPPHFAWIKIAEGCNHPCSFCIIPRIRGRHRSRTTASIVAEARQLVASGVRELNLISQDTTYFGMDRWTERPNPRSPVDSSRGESLATLIRELQAIDGDFWIRLLYTHPAHWSDELISTIAACPKVARYVDMPLQHSSDRMLAAMRRETDAAWLRDLVSRLRAGIPGLTLRTTFIVGFPGETEDDIDDLLGFLDSSRFERVGVFRYSAEEGTRAEKMGDQVPAATREKRWHRVMAHQQPIARSIAAAQVGRRIRVLVDETGVARGEGDAPDIDGRVYVDGSLPVGSFAEVTITAADDYDLFAVPRLSARRRKAPPPPPR